MVRSPACYGKAPWSSVLPVKLPQHKMFTMIRGTSFTKIVGSWMAVLGQNEVDQGWRHIVLQDYLSKRAFWPYKVTHSMAFPNLINGSLPSLA